MGFYLAQVVDRVDGPPEVSFPHIHVSAITSHFLVFRWQCAEDTDQDPNQQLAVTDRHEIREDVEGNVFVKDLRVIPVTTESGEAWRVSCVSHALLKVMCFLMRPFPGTTVVQTL